MKNLAKNIDIMETTEFPYYDILWCDPPWGQKMVNFFQTMMLKDCDIKVNHTIDEILEQLSLLANKSKPMFIQYSWEERENVINILEKKHRYNECVVNIQKNGNKVALISFNTNYKLTDNEFTYRNLEAIVKLNTNCVFFDPFAGIGNTAKRIIKNKAYYIGHELNPKRFQKLEKVITNENLQQK